MFYGVDLHFFCRETTHYDTFMIDSIVAPSDLLF